MRLLVGDVFRRAAAAVPERTAASFGAQALSFGALDAAADGMARALRARGAGHRDRVVWWGDSCLDAVVLFAGLARAGAVFAPVNARLSEEEAAPVVERARPALVVTDDARAGAFGGVTLGELGAEAAGTAGSSAADAAEPALEETDPHVIFFTSGSTGRPKGVVLSHRANVLRTLPAYTVVPGRGATVCMFPMFHMAAWTIGLGCWQAREECAFVAPEPAALLDAVEARRARRLYLIPAVWNRLLEADRSGHDLSTLREADTGTSATPPELLAAIRAALPDTETRVAYGSTEAGPATLLGPADLDRKPGSVGLPCPAVEIALDPATGEIRVRSPFLMDGYFEDPEATAAALDGGWYRTGDLGALDDEGYLSVVGRLRDVIRTGGETVAPAEVEAALAGHPAVADVAVVGLPDAAWGEVVCAVVVPAGGAPVTLEELRAHCGGRLAPFKQPRRLEVVDELPRTAATGQVQRTLLVERLTAGPTRPRR